MSSVTIGRIGNASAFWRASSLWAASVNVSPFFRMTLPSLPTRSAPAEKVDSRASSWATVRLTLR